MPERAIGVTKQDLGTHLKRSECGDAMPVETAPAALSEVKDHLQLFERRFAHRVVADYNLRFDKFVEHRQQTASRAVGFADAT